MSSDRPLTENGQMLCDRIRGVKLYPYEVAHLQKVLAECCAGVDELPPEPHWWREVACAVPCFMGNSNGLFFCKVRVSQAAYDNGEHYDLARQLAMDADCENTLGTVIDEYDMPLLFERMADQVPQKCADPPA